MDNNFLSRKQLRKQKRLEKKEKRDLYFRNRAMKKRRDSINSNKSNRSKLQKNKFKKEKDIKRDKENNIISDDDLEEINTDIKKEVKDDDLEKEINYLEGKLKLKDKKGFEKFNKIITMENYDPDLMDFLGKRIFEKKRFKK